MRREDSRASSALGFAKANPCVRACQSRAPMENLKMHDDVKVNAERQPVVQIKDGGVYADSRDVAQFFGRMHKNVIAAIREMIAKEPELGRRNFQPFKIKDLTGESTSHYEMDRRARQTVCFR